MISAALALLQVSVIIVAACLALIVVAGAVVIIVELIRLIRPD